MSLSILSWLSIRLDLSIRYASRGLLYNLRSFHLFLSQRLYYHKMPHTRKSSTTTSAADKDALRELFGQAYFEIRDRKDDVLYAEAGVRQQAIDVLQENLVSALASTPMILARSFSIDEVRKAT